MSRSNVAPLVLAGAVVAAGLFAILRPETQAASEASPTSAPAMPSPQTADPHAGMAPNLPPDHPRLDQGSMAAPDDSIVAPSDDAPSLVWTPAATWTVLPNPSPMRLATYKVPGSAGDAELAVSRAGGSVDANIARWIGQFDPPPKDARVVKNVRGVDVTIVELSGTYLGGMGMGGMGGGGSTGAQGAHAGWSLLAAIVATKGDPYFFKLTGPTATVRGARPQFDKMIDALNPS